MSIIAKDFEGTGFKGAEFEMKGYQERNLETLLKTLSNKEVQKTVTEMAKIEKEEWLAMGVIALSLKDIAHLGISNVTDLAIFSGLKQGVQDTLKTELAAAFAPLKNELISIVNGLVSQILNLPIVKDAFTWITEMIQRGAGAITAILEGRFDEFLRDLQLQLQEEGVIQEYRTEASERMAAWQEEYWEAYPEQAPQWWRDQRARQSRRDWLIEQASQRELTPDELAELLGNMSFG